MSLAIVLILCNLATFVLAILTVMHTAHLRKLRSVRWLLMLSASFIISSICTVNLYIAPTFDEKVLFFQLRIIGQTFLVPSWLYFISSVFNRWQWLNKKWVMFLLLAPSALNFTIALLPPTRHLLFTDFQPFLYNGVSVVRCSLGSWYRPLYVWSMVLLLMSYVLSGVVFCRERGHRRRQVVILNVGLAVAIGESLVSYLSDGGHAFEWIMVTNVTMLFTQAGIMYAVLRHRLLSLVSLATARIFQQLPDPVLVIDDELRVMGASDRAVSILSLPADFLGQTFAKLLPSVELKPGPVILKDKDQHPHDFHLAVEKITDDTESSPGSVVFFRDIAAQKNIESRLNENLEFRVRLLALLAHDLTGFVESQALMSDALLEGAEPKQRQQLQAFASSARASQDLVGNVMAWVKSQTTNFQVTKRSFEWNSMVEEICEQLEGRLHFKNVALVYRSSKRPVVADGDSELLASAFRNILSNSLRATPAGKKIFIDLEVDPTSASLRVRDEGEGMNASELERIREGSREFSLSGVSKTHGSGIGLMIARHFISLHKGHFHISSELGVGTEVTMTIPL